MSSCRIGDDFMTIINLKRALLRKLPRILSGRYLNYLLNNDCQIDSIIAREYVKNVHRVDIGLFTYGGCFDKGFNIGGKVIIGRYCSIASEVHYFGANHPMSDISTSAYFFNKSFGLAVKDIKREQLEIGNDVWIGFGVIITSNCHIIGNGAVIGAGSIVTHNVPPYVVVAGNPAKIIRNRFSDEEQQMLEKSRWWERTPEELMKYYNCFNNIKEFTDNFY